MLNTIKFVKKISLVKEEQTKGNVDKINDILLSIKPNQVYKKIINPVDFQNQLRNEW